MRGSEVRLVAAAVVAAAAVLSGCSKKASSPTDAVNAYHDAMMKGDVDGVMAVSASSVKRANVEAAIEMRSEGLKRGGMPPVVEEKIDGDKATVTCKFGPVKQKMELVLEDGAWKVVR
jgi:hypothetical protein